MITFSQVVYLFASCLPVVVLPLPFWPRLAIVAAIFYLPQVAPFLSIAAWIWAVSILFTQTFSVYTLLIVLLGIYGLYLNVRAIIRLFKK